MSGGFSHYTIDEFFAEKAKLNEYILNKVFEYFEGRQMPLTLAITALITVAEMLYLKYQDILTDDDELIIAEYLKHFVQQAKYTKERSSQ